jgi:predicted metal-dependent hydrolase
LSADQEQVQVRRPSFAYPADFDAAWHPRRPELAAAANAVSLMMPHAEPLVALAVREAVAALDPADSLGLDAQTYVRQELQHHRQHQHLNELLIAQCPALGRVDRALASIYNRLDDRSLTFRLAFAAGFETVAYGSARWVDDRLHRLFDGAEPTAATLFLWHLAEEVEHKTVAFDVFAAHVAATTDERRFDARARWQRLAGMATAVFLLGLFCVAGTVTILAGQRKRDTPLALARLVVWSISLAFDVLPLAAVSMLPGHHPRSLADPTWYALWLKGYDPAMANLPAWNELVGPGVGPRHEISDPEIHGAVDSGA